MITYVQGDLFTSPAHVLVNTVNTVGVMGKGIAKEFKDVFPEMFEVYQDLCERGELTVGKLLLYRTPHKWILNFPTKRNWRQRSKIEDIEAGLKTFVARYSQLDLTSIAFPQLGCGNGELDWEEQVRPLMERYLGSLPVDVYIHIYESRSLLPEHRDRDWIKSWLRSEPKSLAFTEFWDDLTQGVAQAWQRAETVDGWSVSLLSNDEGEAIEFRRDLEQVELAKEDVLDLWQRFRSYGLLALADVPISYQGIAKPLMVLLARLDYVEETSFVTFPDIRRAKGVTTNGVLGRAETYGIRLVPPVASEAASTQISMFSDLAVA